MWKQLPVMIAWAANMNSTYQFHRCFILLVITINQAIDQMCRVFANGPRDRGSIPGQVISKTQKMVLDAALLTQHYKVRIKGKVEQSREIDVVAIEKGAFGSP